MKTPFTTSANHSIGSTAHEVDTFENLASKVGNATLLKIPVEPAHLAATASTPDATKAYWGDGTWRVPPGGSVGLAGTVGFGQFFANFTTGISAGEVGLDSEVIADTTSLQFVFDAAAAAGAVPDVLLHSVTPGDHLYLQGLDPHTQAAIFQVDSVNEFGSDITFNVTLIPGHQGIRWIAQNYNVLHVPAGAAYTKTVGATSFDPGPAAPGTSFVQCMDSITPLRLGHYVAEFDATLTHTTAGETVSFEIVKDGVAIPFSERAVTIGSNGASHHIHVGPVKAEHDVLIHAWMVRWKATAPAADLAMHTFTVTRVNENF